MQDVIFKTINSAKVLVVGDIILDQYIYGETNRHSPEAPVPIVRFKNPEERPGGAAKVPLNFATIGFNVHLAGLTGNVEANNLSQNTLNKKK